MAKICSKCNQKMSFVQSLFSNEDVCDTCKQEYQQHLREYEQQISTLESSESFSEKDIQSLTLLSNRLGLTEEDIAHYQPQIGNMKMLAELKTGQLPICAADGIMLKKDEVCHYAYPVELAEQKTKAHYVGGSRGISIRLAKGLSYRVGAFKGERVPETYNEITDSGMLNITNRRILFAGTKKNVTYQIKSIISINAFENAIHFQKENEAKPKYFQIKDGNVIQIIDTIVTRLVQETT